MVRGKVRFIFVLGLSLLLPALLAAQGTKLRLLIEPEKVAFYSLDGRDSLVLTPYNTVADSDGVWLDTTLVISPAGLLVGGNWQPAASIESLSVNVSFNETAPIQKSQALGPNDRLALLQPAAVAAGEYLKGNLVALGGEALIEGEVGGDVIVFLGVCRLEDEAVIHGDVIVIGGEIFQKDGAVIYGQLARESQAEHPKRRYFEEPELGALSFSGAYNRVDGFNLNIKVGYKSGDLKSRLWAGGGQAFSRDRWLYDVGFSQKLFDTHQTSFGASAYRRTWSADAWILGKVENSFATLFMRADFMDYTEKEGVALFAGQEYKKIHQFKVTYAVDQYKSLSKETDWSILRGPKRFRKNFSTLPPETLAAYAADLDAEIAALTFDYIFDTRDDPGDPKTGWLAKGEWELAGGALGKNRDYSRITFQFERIQPIIPRHRALVHILYGTSIHRLPLQKLYFLGGIGTLRGYRFKEFYGDRMILVNFEYHARLIDETFVPTPVFFFDWGKTSPRSGDPEFWSGRPFKSNVGLGFKFGGFLRFDLAKAFDDNPLRFTFRFSRNF
ncbi:MAG: BamA/TamA family outer membrane protein [candidate division Zixibacteria bacterium]|nr:BamA/TamA family outer membrane protein [candidate division Zixibacteria bacterium]